MKASEWGAIVAGWFLACSGAAFGVTFQFSGQAIQVSGPGVDAISNLVSIGGLCTGLVYYNSDLAPADGDPSTNNGNYVFGGSDLRISFNIGTNVVSSTDSSFCQVLVTFAGSSPAANELRYTANAGALNGAPFPGATDSQTLYLELNSTNLQALSSDALPAQAPDFNAFPVGGGNGFRDAGFYAYKGGAFYYGVMFNLVSLQVLPALSARVSGGQLLVSWPANSTGFQLQTTQTPAAAVSWSPVAAQVTNQNGSFQVLLPIGAGGAFFRLSQ